MRITVNDFDNSMLTVNSELQLSQKVTEPPAGMSASVIRILWGTAQGSPIVGIIKYSKSLRKCKCNYELYGSMLP